MQGEGYFTSLLNDGNTSLTSDDFNSPPEEQLSPPIVESCPTTRPNQKRSKKINEKEDALLVSAWLNISTDAVQGTNQSCRAFWKRVFEYFHSNKDLFSDHSQSSLLHHWGAIQENVNKFCGCVSQIEGRRQSWVTLQDKLVSAMTLFKGKDKDKKPFQFMHCWNILWNEPKWHDKRKHLAVPKQLPAQNEPANKKQKASTESNPGAATPIPADSSNNATIGTVPPKTDVQKRPMGKKMAKALLW